MFGIGFTELILIAIVLLVVIGPEKLPDIVKDISKLVGQVKKGTDEVKRTVRAEATDLKRWAELEDEPYNASKAEGEEPTDYTAPEADDDTEPDGAASTWKPANTWLPTPDATDNDPKDDSEKSPASNSDDTGEGAGKKPSDGGASS